MNNRRSEPVSGLPWSVNAAGSTGPTTAARPARTRPGVQPERRLRRDGRRVRLPTRDAVRCGLPGAAAGAAAGDPGVTPAGRPPPADCATTTRPKSPGSSTSCTREAPPTGDENSARAREPEATLVRPFTETADRKLECPRDVGPCELGAVVVWLAARSSLRANNRSAPGRWQREQPAATCSPPGVPSTVSRVEEHLAVGEWRVLNVFGRRGSGRVRRRRLPPAPGHEATAWSGSGGHGFYRALGKV